jgi:hypothetical protein
MQVVGQSEGTLLPMTAHGMHVMTPGGHVDAVYNHINRWKPRVQEASLGPTPEPGKAGRTAAAAPIIVQVCAVPPLVQRSPVTPRGRGGMCVGVAAHPLPS